MQATQHANAQVLDKFYNAFARLDTDAMAECYAPDVQFDDEAFSLRGKHEVMGMWRMLCETTKAKALSDWKLVFSAIEADAKTGSARWEADYRFSATNRLVHNVIDGAFEFSDQGKITRHRDRFNFWYWSYQALGTRGALLGWTPFLRRKVRAAAAQNLQRFLAARTAGGI